MALLIVLGVLWVSAIPISLWLGLGARRREERIRQFGSDRQPALLVAPTLDRLRDLAWCRTWLADKIERIYLTRDVEFTMPHPGPSGGTDGTVRGAVGLYLCDTAGVTHQVRGTDEVPEGEVDAVAHALSEACAVPLIRP